MPPFEERRAWLHMHGWHGCTKHPIVIVGETAKRYRIRVESSKILLAGRRRWLEVGSTALVPKTAISENDEVCTPTMNRLIEAFNQTFRR